MLPISVFNTPLFWSSRLATQWLVADRGEPVAYRSMGHAFRKIARDEGYAAFFSGLSASVVGLSHIMIQFPLYEKFKRVGASGGGGGQSGGGRSGADQIWHVIMASAASKLVASTVTYPHELIRARLQFDRGEALYTSMVDCVAKTVRADGILGLWQGYPVNIVRTLPQCVIMFTLYEWLAKRLSHEPARDQGPLAGHGRDVPAGLPAGGDASAACDGGTRTTLPTDESAGAGKRQAALLARTLSDRRA